jgi:hypothetical protein
LIRFKFIPEKTSFFSSGAKMLLFENISLLSRQKENSKICFEKKLKIKTKFFLIFQAVYNNFKQFQTILNNFK